MSESLIAYLATLIVPSAVLCFILWCCTRSGDND